MAGGGEDELDEKPIGELFGDLIDQAEVYAKAELKLAKAEVEAKALGARKPAVLGGAALLFVIAGVVVLCVTMALALATLVGPLAGGLIAAAVTFAIAYALYRLAMMELEKLT
ncbi:MAG TPA: phage holin family protein [Sphingomicrobium sp.]|nr:phage holin family protein [Sphingomicrobium sp.]